MEENGEDKIEIEEKNKDGGDRNKSEEIKESEETIDTVDLIRELKDLENSEYDTRPAKARPVKRLTRSMAKK